MSEDCEQLCLIASQFMLLAAISHDSESVGQWSTVRTVLADSLQDDNDDTLKKNQKASIYYINIDLQYAIMYILLYCNVSSPKTKPTKYYNA